MKKNIAVVTGSRAEYGLLKNLLCLIQNSSEFNLNLFVTGTHLSRKYGLTFREIIRDGFNIYKKIDLKLNSDDSFSVSSSTSIGMKKFAKAFKESKPDLLIVLGDRYELLSAVIPACFSNIPVAHIHGGETTEGAIDEAIRHAITKFSSIHFVATEVYRKRVIQLGEHPSKVFNVGGMGIDSIATTKLLRKIDLEEKLRIKIKDKALIVTYHPVTLHGSRNKQDIKELIMSLQKLKDTTLIITLPNVDVDNLQITSALNKFANKNSNVHLFKSLGQTIYFSLLALVDGVIGNSSSGLLEVPYFRKGTINIGERQKGRLKTKSIIDCKPESDSITKAIKKLYSKNFQNKLIDFQNLYGYKGASKKIFNILNKIEFKKLIQKSFYDIEY